MSKKVDELKKRFPDTYNICYDFGDGNEPVIVGKGTVELLDEIPGAVLVQCTPDDDRRVMTGLYIDEPSSVESNIPFDFTQIIESGTTQIISDLIQFNKNSGK